MEMTGHFNVIKESKVIEKEWKKCGLPYQYNTDCTLHNSDVGSDMNTTFHIIKLK